ncbi:MAG: helix-turn-helix domain-containing protein [Planctomycetota bacterium]|nr:MAG: helix-turn-helix domain-containing protein [Planctomycetota bacterium]
MTTNILKDLREAHESLKDHYQGKRTLKTHSVPPASPVQMTKRRIQKIREQLRVSQEIFARSLHTSRRTIEKWEQGISKPSGATAALLALVEKRPELFDELMAVS